jgi:arylsulfatase
LAQCGSEVRISQRVAIRVFCLQLGPRGFKNPLQNVQRIRVEGQPAPNRLSHCTHRGTLSAVRIDDFKYRFTDQPNGWLGSTVKVDWPILVNLRLGPYERTGLPKSDCGSLAFYNWFAYEFWRFVFVQKEIEKAAQSFVEFPPMQRGATFDLEAVKAQIQSAIAARHGQ